MRKLNLSKKVKVIISVIVGSVVVTAAWAWWYLVGNARPAETLSLHEYLLTVVDHSKLRFVINQRAYTLEVVNTPGSIQQGLSDRSEIGADGMLFVMPAKTNHSFWMPRMQFDLDILWLDEEVITQVTANVPAPPAGTQYWQLPLYTSEKPANMVLELPAGRASLTNLKAGDVLELAK